MITTVFVGIQLATGIVHLPSMQDYWSTNPLVGIPGIVGGMTRDRFRAILSCLHVNDNSAAPARGTPGYNRLYKVRPLLEAIIKTTQASYILHQDVSVDEAMVLFKGRSTLKQYMPMKPTKRGFKCWCLCDARNGLMYNVDVYQGAGEGSGTDGLGAAVVKRMLEPVYDRNHYVYVDNFFSSIALAKALRDRKRYTTGTIRTNRSGWPSSLKDIKGMAKAMQRGESKSIMVDGVECLVWKDNKVVPLVNNISDPNKQSMVPCRNKDGTRSQISCPESVK